MADDDQQAENQTPPSDPKEESNEQLKRIYLVSYPKIVFLYPTFVAALIAGIVMTFLGSAEETEPLAPASANADNEVAKDAKDDVAKDAEDDVAKDAKDAAGDEGADQVTDADANAETTTARKTQLAHTVALVFIFVLATNLIVLGFDFPRTTSLTLFFSFAALAMGLVLVFRMNDQILPTVTSWLKWLGPYCNNQFYFMLTFVLGTIFVMVRISVQFDYWEIRPNELLHHHGVLSDLERFSAPNLRIDKEINDVFEYLLLRSGRLILHPSNERRSIVLENVFFINQKEATITRMLGAVQVQVRESGS